MLWGVLLRAPLLAARVVGLGVVQALFGPRLWLATQAVVVLPRPVPLTGLRLPVFLNVLYGVTARLFAPAHWRSLQFWRRILPIYAAYKRTQLGCIGLSQKGRDKRWAVRHEWGARRVYALCVELRGFYLKDGQFIGARTDFVPPAWCTLLRALQDRVPPVGYREIETTLQESYCVNSMRQLFRSLDEKPIASATIAQVHRGKLRDGTDIALKAQYCNQERLCTLDLLNLKRLAAFLHRFDMKFFDMDSVVREFEKQIPMEFDFVREAVAMTLIRQNLARAGIQNVLIPRAIPGLVTRRALCMTFVEGCRPDNAVALERWSVKPDVVVRTLGEVYGHMLLVDGLAHCDPHMGNVLVRPDGRVGLIDFGQCKVVPEDLRRRLCVFYLALYTGNKLAIMKAFGDLGIELSVPFSEMDERLKDMVPVYANGLLDTAPLPDGIEIDPFSANSPLKNLPIRKFNQDLFMVLRTMGLLRVLANTLGVDTPMSTFFRPFALRGLVRSGPSPAARKRRADEVRATLLSRVASPFTIDGDAGYCNLS